MNIIEAIRSGKPWRPKNGDGRWRDPIVRTPGYNGISFEVGELFAEFEIQEPAVTITRTQFLQAFGLMYCAPEYEKRVVDSTFGIELARKLGFDDT